MQTPAQNDQLLADLIGANVAQPTAPSTPLAPPVTAIRTERRPATIGKGLYDRAGMTLALLLTLTIGAGLWAGGAFFTLSFFGSIGLQLDPRNVAAWLLPLAITAGELWMWPRANQRWQAVLIFFTVLAFDIGTSWAGAVQWGSGRHIPLFAGFTLAQSGWTLHILALIAGLAFAFLPEKIARYALTELQRTWR